MPSVTLPVAALGAGALGAVGSVASGIIGGNAAQSAAATQAAAANTASNNTLNMFNQTQANLSPFVTGGTSAFNALQGLTGAGPGGNPLTAPLTAEFNPTMAQLAQTPGYQFTLGQGEQAAINANAATGLGGGVSGINNPGGASANPSGALGKSLVNYAEGLAGTTYQQQFQNYLSQNQQIANILGGQASTGENAAAMTGQQGLTASGQAGNFLTSGAAASAAGTIGSANSAINALSGVSGSANNTAMMLALNNSGMFSNTSSLQGGQM